MVVDQLKDLKGTVAASSDMIDQANQLSGAAQANAAAMQPRGNETPPERWPVGKPAEEPDYEPIAGVSLELYTEIAKSLATVNYNHIQGTRDGGQEGRRGRGLAGGGRRVERPE